MNNYCYSQLSGEAGEAMATVQPHQLGGPLGTAVPDRQP